TRRSSDLPPGRATRTQAPLGSNPAGSVRATTAVFGFKSLGAFSGGVAALAATLPAASSTQTLPVGASWAPRLWMVTFRLRLDRFTSSRPMPRSGRPSVGGPALARSKVSTVVWRGANSTAMEALFSRGTVLVTGASAVSPLAAETPEVILQSPAVTFQPVICARTGRPVVL